MCGTCDWWKSMCLCGVYVICVPKCECVWCVSMGIVWCVCVCVH